MEPALTPNPLVNPLGWLQATGDRSWLTTAQAGEVMSWLEYLLQMQWPELNVQVASLTDEWAGMAVSGPRSREALQLAFPAADVSNEALPHMACPSCGNYRGRTYRSAIQPAHTK